MAAASHDGRILIVKNGEHATVFHQRDRLLHISQAVANGDSLLVFTTYRRIAEERTATRKRVPAVEAQVEMTGAVESVRVRGDFGLAMLDLARRPDGGVLSDLSAECIAVR